MPSSVPMPAPCKCGWPAPRACECCGEQYLEAAEGDDDGCPKGDPDCYAGNGDCHDECSTFAERARQRLVEDQVQTLVRALRPEQLAAEFLRLRAALAAIANQGRMPNGADVFNGTHHREAVMIAREALDV